jgi:hypothetical protein
MTEGALPNCDWEYLLSLNEGLGIGPLVGILNYSQLVPSAKPAGYLHRRDCPAWPGGTDVPGKPGGFRAELGGGPVGYSNPAVRARMMAWARSET